MSGVLAAGREPWLAIDPKPYLGDPTYDPLQHMLNFRALRLTLSRVPIDSSVPTEKIGSDYGGGWSPCRW